MKQRFFLKKKSTGSPAIIVLACNENSMVPLFHVKAIFGALQANNY
jgi:hypothetical protein